MNTGKTIALTRWTILGKVLSLLLNMLSSFAIAFLPRSKYLLISWLQSPSAVILEPRKIKSTTVSIVSPSICHEGMGLDAMNSAFEYSVLSQLFHFPLTPSSEALYFFFAFCHYGGVIHISEVIDISPDNIVPILCIIQPDISHDVLCI